MAQTSKEPLPLTPQPAPRTPGPRPVARPPKICRVDCGAYRSRQRSENGAEWITEFPSIALATNSTIVLRDVCVDTRFVPTNSITIPDGGLPISIDYVPWNYPVTQSNNYICGWNPQLNPDAQVYPSRSFAWYTQTPYYWVIYDSASGKFVPLERTFTATIPSGVYTCDQLASTVTTLMAKLPEYIQGPQAAVSGPQAPNFRTWDEYWPGGDSEIGQLPYDRRTITTSGCMAFQAADAVLAAPAEGDNWWMGLPYSTGAEELTAEPRVRMVSCVFDTDDINGYDVAGGEAIPPLKANGFQVCAANNGLAPSIMLGYTQMLGASQASLEYDSVGNRFMLNLATPLENAASGSGPTPCVGTTWVAYNCDGNVVPGQQQIFYPCRGGVFVRDMQPRSFWEGVLGFGVEDMLVKFKPAVPSTIAGHTVVPGRAMTPPFYGVYTTGGIKLQPGADLTPDVWAPGDVPDVSSIFRKMCGQALVSAGMFDEVFQDPVYGSSTPGLAAGYDPMSFFTSVHPPDTLTRMFFIQAQDSVPWVAASAPDTADAGEYWIQIELDGYDSGAVTQDGGANMLIAKVPKYYLTQGAFSYQSQIGSFSALYEGPGLTTSSVRVRIVDPLTGRAARVGKNSSITLEFEIPQ